MRSRIRTIALATTMLGGLAGGMVVQAVDPSGTTFLPLIINQPAPTPTLEPTPEPTVEPTAEPTPEPTVEPTPVPTAEPTSVPVPTAEPTTAPACDPAYPDVCIPPPPPDLDCSDIPYRRFRVLPPDPHQFDRDGNGIGCESD